MLLKSPSGYIQQSPWLSISNKQLEIMGRYMAELGLTPSARSRLNSANPPPERTPMTITRVIIAPPDAGTMTDSKAETFEAAAAPDRIASDDGHQE